MARAKESSRLVLMLAVFAIIAAALTSAFWPKATKVDLGEVSKGPLVVTIDEEGRTRVSEPYVVATPVAGRLKRVEVDPGDRVERGKTIVAHMLPTNPAALDVRTREQAQAAVAAAKAALRVAHADRNAAMASRDLSQHELSRTERLAQSQITSEAALDRARQDYRVAEAVVETTEAAISMREAEVVNAEAQLIGFDDQRLATALVGDGNNDIPLRAPADGRILRIIQKSETTLPAGAPIMEIGNVEDDLEVVADLISSDAVKVHVGDRVIIGGWGGKGDLTGVVSRIDPFAITKVSALGVEEQRVPVTIDLTSDTQDYAGLGHGYRVETRIVVWEAEDTIQIPTSALFRVGDGWFVFVEDNGRARRQPVVIGPSNGIWSQLLEGLDEGDDVVLYPSAAVVDGGAISRRIAE